MRRTLVVVVLALWALIGLPGTAHAGGPTSVLITNPSTGEAAAFYYTSQEYADLERLLTDPSRRRPPDCPIGSGAGQYTVTWLIHDVQPWRIDTVHLDASGAAFATTRLVGDDDSLAQESAQSQGGEIAQGAELAALLDRAVAGDSSRAGSRTLVQPALTGESPQPSAPEPTTRWFSLTGWRWIVPGVLIGVLASLLATRRRPSGEPRQVLLDRDPGRVGA